MSRSLPHTETANSAAPWSIVPSDGLLAVVRGTSLSGTLSGTPNSLNSGANWTAYHKMEQGLNATQMRGVHTAYSSLLPLNETRVSLVYKRGLMGSRVGAGEYARTIHWQAVRLPAVMLAILVARGGGEGSGRLGCWNTAEPYKYVFANIPVVAARGPDG